MTPPPVRTLIIANALCLLLVGACGGAVAVARAHRVVLTRPAAASRVDVTQNIVGIVRQNGRVWLFVCVGVVSFGAVGTGLLLANGFRFGMDAATVAASVEGELRFLLPHSVLEFAAFVLAVAAVQHLGWCLWELLVTNTTVGRPVAAGVTLAASAALGVVAAVVEAYGMAVRVG